LTVLLAKQFRVKELVRRILHGFQYALNIGFVFFCHLACRFAHLFRTHSKKNANASTGKDATAITNVKGHMRIADNLMS
jgi:hypothetical protein